MCLEKAINLNIIDSFLAQTWYPKQMMRRSPSRASLRMARPSRPSPTPSIHPARRPLAARVATLNQTTVDQSYNQPYSLERLNLYFVYLESISIRVGDEYQADLRNYKGN